MNRKVDKNGDEWAPLVNFMNNWAGGAINYGWETDAWMKIKKKGKVNYVPASVRIKTPEELEATYQAEYPLEQSFNSRRYPLLLFDSTNNSFLLTQSADKRQIPLITDLATCYSFNCFSQVILHF